MTIPALIAGGASIVGGILGSNSAEAQNREEREWQEKMANTQYQRSVADMRAAGLNPAMLYGKGPMSAPVAGGARMDEGRALSEGVRGAGAVGAQMLLQGQLTKAQINDVNSAAALKLAEKEKTELSTRIMKGDFEGELGMWEGDPKNVNMDVWMTQRGARRRRAAEQEIAESVARVANMSAQEAEARARAALTGVEKMMLDKKMSFADAWDAYWRQVGVLGAYAEVGGRLFRDVAGTLGIANIGNRLLKYGEKVGQRDGGANSARSVERRENFYNNDSDLIGR